MSGGPLSGRERAFRLRSPNYPYLPCISCLVFCQFASPRFVTWWPKWPEPAEDTSGASGCVRASRTPRCPGPCPAPDVRCPVSSWSPAQSEIFVREERSRTSRLLRLQLCANIHSHFVTSPTMPNHVCCSATRQTRGDQASACSRHKSKKPKSRAALFLCASV